MGTIDELCLTTAEIGFPVRGLMHAALHAGCYASSAPNSAVPISYFYALERSTFKQCIPLVRTLLSSGLVQ